MRETAQIHAMVHHPEVVVAGAAQIDRQRHGSQCDRAKMIKIRKACIERANTDATVAMHHPEVVVAGANRSDMDRSRSDMDRSRRQQREQS